MTTNKFRACIINKAHGGKGKVFNHELIYERIFRFVLLSIKNVLLYAFLKIYVHTKPASNGLASGPAGILLNMRKISAYLN